MFGDVPKRFDSRRMRSMKDAVSGEPDVHKPPCRRFAIGYGAPGQAANCLACQTLLYPEVGLGPGCTIALD